MPVEALQATGRSRPKSEAKPAPRRPILRPLVALFILGPLVTLAFTMSAELVDDDQMLDAIVEAGDDGPLNAVNRTPTRLLTPADRWTECLVLTMGIGDEHFGSTLNQTLRSSTFGPCDASTRHINAAQAAGEPVRADNEYFRYWWSAESILRPSVVLLGMPATRVLLQCAAIAAFALLLGAWRRRFGWLFSLAVLGPLVVATDFIVLYESMPQAIAVTAALLTSLLTLVLVERGEHPRDVIVPAAIAGAVLLPFDLMMVIPLALTLCVLTTVLVGSQQQPENPRLFLRAAAAGFGWLLGFGWLWASKWLAVSLVIGPQKVIDNITASVQFRIGQEIPGSASGPFQGIISNLEFWWRHNFGLAALAFEALLVAVALALWTRRASGQTIPHPVRAQLAVVASCALIPFAWYEFASNHSQIHNWFMFRAVPLSVGIVAGVVILALQATDHRMTT